MTLTLYRHIIFLTTSRAVFINNFVDIKKVNLNVLHIKINIMGKDSF